MKKIGASERRDGITQIGRRRWEICYGYVEEDGQGFVFVEEVEHIPSESEVKKMILDQINENVKEAILHGMRYKGRTVWLSAENQRDISFAYTNAIGNKDGTLPTMKLGTDDDYIMYQFADADEVVSFALSVHEHLCLCLANGREEKENVDWSKYMKP